MINKKVRTWGASWLSPVSLLWHTFQQCDFGSPKCKAKIAKEMNWEQCTAIKLGKIYCSLEYAVSAHQTKDLWTKYCVLDRRTNDMLKHSKLNTHRTRPGPYLTTPHPTLPRWATVASNYLPKSPNFSIILVEWTNDWNCCHNLRRMQFYINFQMANYKRVRFCKKCSIKLLASQSK